MRRLLLILAGVAGAATAVVFPALAADQSVTVGDNHFSPATVAVRPGESVTISSPGTANAHNVRFVGDASANPVAPSNMAFTVTRSFATAGTYRFYCEVHGNASGGGMSGVVYVDDAGTVPAPPSGTTTTTTTTATDPYGTAPTTSSTSTTQPGTPSTMPTTLVGAAAPRLRAAVAAASHARGLAVRVRLSAAATVTATLRHGATRRTVRFPAARGVTRRTLVRRPARGRWTVALVARSATGRASPRVRLVARVGR